MTKEAKVGMLTGLAVIVLIGVLLSEYLGGPAVGGSAAGNNVATGRMATLPIGETKREEILQPVGVPSMARAGEGAGTGVLAQVPAAYATLNPQQNASAPASAVVPEVPVVKAPVSAVPAGPVELVSAQRNEMPATVQLGDVKPAAAGLSAPAVDGAQGAAKAAPVKASGQEYVIAKGDSLNKIARKFYKSDTSADRGRITAANPSLMKNGQPFLIAGRTIVIPDAPTAAAPVAAKTAAGASAKSAEAGVVIHQPGAATAGHGVATASADAPVKAKAGKTYVVKPGDSLEKIAKRVDSANYRDAEKKLMALNGIKDAGSLQAGATLKLPL
jgi:LysM repeat protein